MNRVRIIVAVICVTPGVSPLSAQVRPDFSGIWR